MVFFSLLLITGISLTPYLQLGLDQSEALPQDSYLIPYFVDQSSLLKVGSPVYFVIQGGNVTQNETQAQFCATFKECAQYSAPNIIVQESSRPEYSTVALRPSLWLDDYINWLNPENDLWYVHVCMVARSVHGPDRELIRDGASMRVLVWAGGRAGVVHPLLTAAATTASRAVTARRPRSTATAVCATPPRPTKTLPLLRKVCARGGEWSGAKRGGGVQGRSSPPATNAVR